MGDILVSGAQAEYRGKRFRILFGGDDWVALRAEAGDDVPDAFARGESPTSPGHSEPWAKVPMSAVDGVVDVLVSGTIAGQSVSLRRQLPDGRIGVEFVGPPAVAKKLGLDGDQYMGWTGLFAPEELEDIRVEETRRA
jgi:hypothetical protein